MNSVFLYLFSFILTVSHSVCSQKYQNIGECQGRYFLTLICVEKYVDTDILSDSETYTWCDGSFEKSSTGRINFKNCEFSQVPNIPFKLYYNVYSFDISNLGVDSLQPENFVGAKKLEYLYVTENKLTKIPANLFYEAVNLVKLDLSNNQINYFDSNSFSAGNHLNRLNMSYNNFSELPFETFQKLIELQTLDISHNKIAEIPSFLFYKMEKLNEINLSHNKITRIDYFAFSSALGLQKVILAHNQLKILNRRVFDVSVHDVNVTHLDISCNQINVLKEDTMAILSNLVYFNASSNPIKEMTNKTFVNQVNLQHLYLSRSNLSVIKPGTFSTLNKLESLDLSRCGLKEVQPGTFSTRNKLESLDLSQCSLTKIKPGTFSSLTNLKKFNLSHNQLKTLDVNNILAQPNQMTFLSIADNQLRELNGFTASNIANLTIAGIDSNKFNCSYYAKLFEIITPHHLDTISKRFNCSSDNEEETVQDNLESTTFNLIESMSSSTVSSLEIIDPYIHTSMKTITNHFDETRTPSLTWKTENASETTKDKSTQTNETNGKIETTSKAEMLQKTNHIFYSMTEKVTALHGSTTDAGTTGKIQSETERIVNLELSHRKLTENETNLYVHNHLIAMHNKLESNEKYFFVLVCLFITGFSIIGFALIWIILRTQYFKKFETANIFYRQSKSDLDNAVENNQYEVIGFNKE